MKYTIHVPKDYSHQAALLEHFKRDLSDSDIYVFVEDETILRPRAESAEDCFKLGLLAGDGGMGRINDSIRRFHDSLQ